MCGISGIISSTGDLSKIYSMNELIAHRGPDGSGYFFGDYISLGHRRLAIVDLSDSGHQPMSYLERYVIVYNGEVYNHIELRADLLKLGYTFNGKSDTEVILAAYDAWGVGCVNFFNGMWAFAIYDQLKKTVFCSRDRFGIKPLYFSQLDDVFAFGSEIKQLLGFQTKIQVNNKVLVDFLVTGLSEHTNETFFEGIFTLPGGHNLVFDLSSFSYQIFKWYQMKDDESLRNLSEVEAVEAYRSGFVSSIEFRLRSDVLVGTCLSGGLDSSSDAAVAAQKFNASSGIRFKGIHVKSSEVESDESRFASMVADYNEIDLTVLTPTVEDFKKVIDEVIYCQEEPFPDTSIFMQYFVKKARELGCVVMLDGQGCDETLLGYERCYPAYFLSLPFWQAGKAFFNVLGIRDFRQSNWQPFVFTSRFGR